ncbi:maleylpyruvate isomerase family mycothiol-dependent enzyme [Klenkia sp. PcliD-1-E]|uniref:maleylpyruvate isomerase family mycothiol-dependent enzyme n=1 Tax=Klenkia sp. PcliD-1-E TaxID=2954492 RepID=UPI0020972199|nr:maleylpyruvate isomerase family mycothiol-dependent enzyme [Klenkia sp. PcliD-1-E]MCO7219295.1 maleylpyruvate isomerase family mycothiol-dependent enzyme [Klenkia sp. PcliD-1-E]
MQLTDAEAIEEWTRAQARVVELVEGIPTADAARPVPACPAWSVRDLLAHVVGVSTDVLADREDDDHNPAWTQRHVDTRAGRDVPLLVAEWRANTAPLRAWMAEHGVRPLADVTIHEQDLRGALGVPGAHDTPAMVALRDRFADRVAEAAAEAGLPPLRLEGSSWQHGPADAAVVVRAGDFDLARAVQARRSADQLRSWTARGDVEPYLDCFATLGPLPERDLTDGAT